MSRRRQVSHTDHGAWEQPQLMGPADMVSYSARSEQSALENGREHKREACRTCAKSRIAPRAAESTRSQLTSETGSDCLVVLNIFHRSCEIAVLCSPVLAAFLKVQRSTNAKAFVFFVFLPEPLGTCIKFVCVSFKKHQTLRWCICKNKCTDLRKM